MIEGTSGNNRLDAESVSDSICLSQRNLRSVAKVNTWSSWRFWIWQTFKWYHDFWLIFLFYLSFGSSSEDAKKVDIENKNEVAE